MKKLTAILMMLAFGAVVQPLTSLAEEDYGTSVEESEGGMDDSMQMDDASGSYDESDAADAEDYSGEEENAGGQE